MKYRLAPTNYDEWLQDRHDNPRIPPGWKILLQQFLRHEESKRAAEVRTRRCNQDEPCTCRWKSG